MPLSYQSASISCQSTTHAEQAINSAAARMPGAVRCGGMMRHLLAAACMVSAGAAPPLTCQPRQVQRPIFHIVGNVSINSSGTPIFENINDANGVFRYKGVWHVFHQCCQNHWDHVVSHDLVKWKRLPSPARPGKQWYDSGGSFDGSAAILPGKGPVILVDNIGPFTPPDSLTGGAQVGLGDNPGCQGLSWPVDLQDPELTHWRKDLRNPLNMSNLPCGSRVKNTAGAFPGGIFQNGDHWNYLSFGYRFTTTDPLLHNWRQAEQQFLSNASARENGGQWTLRLPATTAGALAPPGTPTHMVSCGGGTRFCLGDYHLQNETWVDAAAPAGPPVEDSLCTTFGFDWDVPGGDYNQNSSTTRALYKDCVADGNCPCQAACLADSRCQAWTVIGGERAKWGANSRCCLKHKTIYNPRRIPKAAGWVTGVKDPQRCAQGGDGGNAVAYSEAVGSDSGWWTAGYASGGLGSPGAGDRLLNLGWVIKERHGALTVPRELHWEPATHGLLANPVDELVGLRNGSLYASSTNLTVEDGTPQLLQGTEGGQAISADVELSWELPPPTVSSATFGVLVLSAPAEQTLANNSGVTVTVRVEAAAADDSRAATLTVFGCGSVGPGQVGTCGTQAGARPHRFTVLKGEQRLQMRLLIDRTIVEAFVLGGRVAFTKVHTPADWRHSSVQLLASNGSAMCAVANVWSMGCGWVGVDEQ